ncbi:MAG: hypothetical protein EOM08_01475 [Clostridia bacterium]|nr:hypothetical protein [Clostridia bacterium]NCC75086.1 hypothetical protein [Clostridia bacterium]
MLTFKSHAPWFLLGLVLWAIVYHLLPAVACRFDSRLASAFYRKQPELDYSWLSRLPSHWVESLSQRLLAAGFRERKSVAIYLLTMAAPVALLVLLATILRGPVHLYCLTGSLVAVLVNGWITHRIRQRRQSFQLSLYKIYRFLDLQLTAGVNAFDVLKGLPEAIAQPLIREDFLRFSARLELTQDLDLALDELQAAFTGPDMSLLASQLRNSMQTGVMGQTFQRMENLLFNRHLSLVRARSKQLRNDLLMVALLVLVPIEILYLYPLAAQAVLSLGQLYGP